MTAVDDFQNGQEAIAQLEADRKEADALRLKETLSTPAVFGDPSQGTYKIVAVEDIVARNNVRTGALTEIPELAESIKERGLLSPVLVRVDPKADSDEKYVIVAGHRRFEAIQLLEWATVPVIVTTDEVDDDYAMELTLLENVQRQDLEPIQAARGLRAIMKRRGDMSAAKLGKSLGLSTSWISRHLKLLELPEEVQQRITDGDLSVTIADLIRRQEAKGNITKKEAVDYANQVAQGDMTPAEIKATFGESDKPKPDAKVKGVHRAGDGPEPRGGDDWDDEGSTAEAESREYEVPDYKPKRADDTRVEGEEGVPAVWDNSPIKERVEGEASLGQIYSQLDRYLLAWLSDKSSAVFEAVPLPENLDDISAGDLSAMVRRCAQALLRSDAAAAAKFPDAVNRVL